jgi:hypothetical protein
VSRLDRITPIPRKREIQTPVQALLGSPGGLLMTNALHSRTASPVPPKPLRSAIQHPPVHRFSRIQRNFPHPANHLPVSTPCPSMSACYREDSKENHRQPDPATAPPRSGCLFYRPCNVTNCDYFTRNWLRSAKLHVSTPGSSPAPAERPRVVSPKLASFCQTARQHPRIVSQTPPTARVALQIGFIPAKLHVSPPGSSPTLPKSPSSRPSTRHHPPYRLPPSQILPCTFP